MKETKLINLLSSFSPGELKRLKLMALSPFFNNQVSVRKLLDFLLQFAPDFDQAKMSYNNAFKYIYSDREIQSDTQVAVSKVMSKLMNLVREFIIQQELSNHPITRTLLQVQYLNEKSFLDPVPKLFQEADDILNTLPFRDEYYYRHKLILEYERSSFLNTTQDKSFPDYNLNRQNRALDTYYAMTKLRTYCFAKNELGRINFEFDLSPIPVFIEWLKNSGLLSDQYINTWFQALILLHTPDANGYKSLKHAINLHTQKLGSQELRVLYSYLTNTAQVIFREREVYFKELFQLYTEQIDLKILYINGYLSPVMLRNITIVGLKLKEFDRVDRFLQENEDKIVPTYVEREDIILLCKAYFYFAKGEFQQTLDTINLLRYDSLFTKMDERRLRLMCYFEMRIESPLEDLVNSFRKFLTDHKKKIPAGYLEANRTFIHFIHKIAALRFKNKEQAALLKEEILQVAVLPEKEWLLDKAAESAS